MTHTFFIELSSVTLIRFMSLIDIGGKEEPSLSFAPCLQFDSLENFSIYLQLSVERCPSSDATAAVELLEMLTWRYLELRDVSGTLCSM